MQLEQILSAAVAAGDVNQIDIDEIPSPDVPTASPSAPTSPPTRPCVGPPSPCASPLSISPGLDNIVNSTSAVDRTKSLMVPADDKSLDIFPKECSPMSSNNTLHGDLTECDPLSAVDDFSLFNLREDSLVITSQQALAMFENSNDGGNTSFHQRSSFSPKDTLKSQKEPAAFCPKSIRTGHHAPPQTLESVELRADDDLGDVPAACGEVEIETSTASPNPVTEKFNEDIIISSPVVHSVENFEVPYLELEHSSKRDDDQGITCEESDNVIDDLPDITVANNLHTKDKMNSLENSTKKSASHVSDTLLQDFNVSKTNDALIVPRSSNSAQLPANIVVVSRQEAFEQASLTQTFDSSVTSSLNESDNSSRQDAEAEPLSQILSQTINEVLNEACGTGIPDESSTLEAFDNIEKIFDMTSPTSFFKNQTATLSFSSDVRESHCAPSSEDTQLQYTALTPVSSTASVNPLLEDNLGSLSGLEPLAGATIDATLDENGQFLVQVIAPGLNMSIPNQFLNKIKPKEMSYNKTNSASSHSSADVDEHVQALENIKCSEIKDSSRVQKKKFDRHNVTRKRRISPDALETVHSVSTTKKQCKAVNEKNIKCISSKTHKTSAKTDCKKMKKKKKRRKYLEQMMTAGGTTENNLNKYKQPPQFSLYHSHMNVNSYTYPPYNYYPHQVCNYGQPRNYYGPNAPYNLYYKSAFSPPIQSNHTNYENCTWSMEEMLNSRTTHPTAYKEFHAGFYDCFDSFDDSFNSSRPPAVNDQCDVPIIMSPEEYHSKLQNGGQLPGNVGSAELVQTDTDGESLKVQLVYLVYPTKKSSGEGRRPGVHEQDFWQNEHRKDAIHLPCDAEFGVDVPPHGLFPQCPGAPVPRHGDDVAVYPSHPSQHYGYGPPQQYMYEREDLQTNPTPAGTTAPSLSARDKTISWLSSGDSSSFTPYKPADAITSSTSNNTSSAKKSDDYRGRPMSTWEFRHVAHFLIEATHDLGIQYEDTDFSQLSKVNGQKLISMGPEHYEKFAPTQGQRIFDYVRRHRNHEVLTDGALDTCTESSPDVSSVRSIETPPVSFGAPTWPSVSDDTYSYYPPAETFPVENSFSNVKNQSSPTSSKVPSPYAPMSVETSLPTTSTFSDPFQFQEGSCSSDSAAKQQTHLVPTSLSTPYSTQSLMNSGPLLPPASVESTTSYHSQMLRPPTSSSGSHQDKSGLHDTIRPSSRMSAATSEIEESSDDDEDDGEGDDEEEEEEEEVEEKVVEEKPPEPPKKRGPGRPPKPESERKKKKKTGRLWEFIRNLLLNPETCPSIVKWEDPETGVFRFVQSEKVAERWGMRKNNKKMNYEKLSRAMRYYYKGKVFEPVLGRRLVYKFGVNAKGWKPNEGNFGE